jgi:UTP:GlnB (protein PII) uridylyltransferase
VKTPDRPGLLFDIATVFQQHRINVHLALIMTESYQVVDVFYVTDWENNRLEPGPRTESLQRDLLAISSPSPESALGVSILAEELPPEPC